MSIAKSQLRNHLSYQSYQQGRQSCSWLRAVRLRKIKVRLPAPIDCGQHPLFSMDFRAIGSPNVEVKADEESRDQMEKQLQAIVTVLSLVNPLICGAMFAQIDAGQSRATQLADATRVAQRS